VQFVPDEPEVIGGANHRVTLTLVAHTAADGRSQFSSKAGSEPPVIRVRPGDKLAITYKNELVSNSTEQCATGPCMNMTNLHFHGLMVSPKPGQDDVIGMIARPGESLHYLLDIPKDQVPGLFWYHTHPHGESMRQDLDGMSGAIVVEGIDRYVPETRGLRERIIVIRERPADPHSRAQVPALEQSLGIPQVSCGGEQGSLERVFTVNNVLRPSIKIAPHERQFWRVVNAAPDRYTDLQLDGQIFEVVAMDGMPLAYSRPAERILRTDHVLLPPGGRVEAIVEGPSHRGATLRTRCVDTGVSGDGNPGMVLADINPNSSTSEEHRSIEPDYGPPTPKLIDVGRFEKTSPDFVVKFTEDKQGFYINSQKYEPNAEPMVRVHIGSYQHWRIINDTREIHPMHIHQVHFLAFATNHTPMRNPLWLDTVNVPVDGSVDVIMDFTNPVIKGMSVFHCHLLNHEDKGMMAKILFE
jgi:FtsP/CotA-like multicopper oxidase with cupredoxin domain